MNHIVFSGMIDGLVLDRVIRDSEFNMPTKHFHNEYEIYYLLEGARYYFIENKTYLVKKGSLVLVDQQLIHKTSSASNLPHDRILIELSDKPFSKFFDQLCNISIRRFFSDNCGVLELDEDGQKYVESILHSIMDELTLKNPHYSTFVMMKLTELLIYIIRYNTENSTFAKAITADTAKHRKVHEIVQYITKNYAKAITLNDLSKQFYISKCYLSRIFKEVTGFTVNEYINVNRIKRAQYLLTHSAYNISEIAENVGYDSLTYFERVFKKYTETSPLKYRKKALLITQRARERKAEKGLKK